MGTPAWGDFYVWGDFTVWGADEEIPPGAGAYNEDEGYYQSEDPDYQGGS